MGAPGTGAPAATGLGPNGSIEPFPLTQTGQGGPNGLGPQEMFGTPGTSPMLPPGLASFLQMLYGGGGGGGQGSMPASNGPNLPPSSSPPQLSADQQSIPTIPPQLAAGPSANAGVPPSPGGASGSPSGGSQGPFPLGEVLPPGFFNSTIPGSPQTYGQPSQGLPIGQIANPSQSYAQSGGMNQSLFGNTTNNQYSTPPSGGTPG